MLKRKSDGISETPWIHSAAKRHLSWSRHCKINNLFTPQINKLDTEITNVKQGNIRK